MPRIIAALDNGEYRAAIEEIDAYLRRSTALVVSGYADIPHLRFLLQSLELRIESLSDEKAELERRLITFNRRHDDTLGDLIQRLLKARAELAQMLVVDRERYDKSDKVEAEAAAQEAQSAYQDYFRQHEELQKAEPLPQLDKEAEQELKALYRKACSVCHPDKVSEERKEDANRAFVELQTAYKGNDLARVRKIYKTLASGGLLATRSTTLSQVDALKAAIAELEYAIARLVLELKALQRSDGAMMMDSAGTTEADWQHFFEQQRDILEMELISAASQILAAHKAEIEVS